MKTFTALLLSLFMIPLTGCTLYAVDSDTHTFESTYAEVVSIDGEYFTVQSDDSETETVCIERSVTIVKGRITIAADEIRESDDICLTYTDGKLTSVHVETGDRNKQDGEYQPEDKIMEENPESFDQGDKGMEEAPEETDSTEIGN